jgi:hypothetical protein
MKRFAYLVPRRSANVGFPDGLQAIETAARAPRVPRGFSETATHDLEVSSLGG